METATFNATKISTMFQTCSSVVRLIKQKKFKQLTHISEIKKDQWLRKTVMLERSEEISLAEEWQEDGWMAPKTGATTHCQKISQLRPTDTSEEVSQWVRSAKTFSRTTAIWLTNYCILISIKENHLTTETQAISTVTKLSNTMITEF